jgi:hypothetical protein
MDAYGTARLAAKEAESAIVARICEDFNLTPVLARAHYEQMARYFAERGMWRPSMVSSAIWPSTLMSHRASRSCDAARSK